MKDVHAAKTSVLAFTLQGLSLPLVREARGGLSSWFSAGKPPSSITDCLAAFTADETLQVQARSSDSMSRVRCQLSS
jgi:hypothetical protein